MNNGNLNLYRGDGTSLASRGGQMPLYADAIYAENPACYVADSGLRAAVNVSVALGQPLLVTGEPGTGKTQLASSMAWDLGLPGPLEFRTKTTSTAVDLFYRYDTLRHFHDSQFVRERIESEQYVTYEAMGLAVLLSLNPKESASFLPVDLRGKGPVRSVVLVDEIDKAPRDLPNDVLNEIESMSFTVRETGRCFTANPLYRPVVVLTSNSEKNLPDAFLRRCVFYHIGFPDSVRLRQILSRRVRLHPDFTSEMLDHAIEHFDQIRSLALKKKPATAELLAWVRILENLRIDIKNLQPGQAEALAISYSVLAKTQEDLERLRKTFAQ